jgi:hypothetical protein
MVTCLFRRFLSTRNGVGTRFSSRGQLAACIHPSEIDPTDPIRETTIKAVLTAAWIANGIVAGLTASVISLEL